MTAIHPTAIIHPTARLDSTVEVGPYSLIEADVTIGPRTVIGPHCFIAAGTRLGAENQIHFGAVIGHAPQDLAYKGEPTHTQIGDRNTIREYVTIHRGTTPGSSTAIGSDNFFMANAHIAHNCHVGDHVILANLATLAGHCIVEDQAFLAGMVVCHQFTRIGRLAMLGGLSAINKDIPPFMICAGRPGVIRGVNLVGLRRAGLKPDARQAIVRAFKTLYRSGLNVSQALDRINDEAPTPEVRELAAFIKAATRGICDGAETAEETPYSNQHPKMALTADDLDDTVDAT